MAINFPSSPTVGQTFVVGSVTYTWDGTKWYTNISGSTSGITTGKAIAMALVFGG